MSKLFILNAYFEKLYTSKHRAHFNEIHPVSNKDIQATLED